MSDDRPDAAWLQARPDKHKTVRPSFLMENTPASAVSSDPTTAIQMNFDVSTCRPDQKEIEMDHLPNSAAARDISYLLHPNTNARKHEKTGPIIIDHGKGVFVYDDQGKEYIEAMAGLWSVGVGFGEERLVKAAAAQMTKLPYYHLFGSKSTGPAIDLAEILVQITPPGLDRVMYTNSGS